ncbi:PBCV-specific basic adaptor domain-containing protein [Paramecium bursaria Chlorella virus AP110A]|nr:PBCV-specific basic adaptor domain-containing protein [Paramecium bursaria Chlorella virus AP110A]
MQDTGKVDAKNRVVFSDKGKTFVMQDGKKVYVKKLFSPKEVPKNVPTKYARIWKSKVDARLKPSRKGIRKNDVNFVMPTVRFSLNTLNGSLKRVNNAIRIPLDFKKGGAVNSRDIVAMKKNNVDPTWFFAQVKYLRSLNDYDIMTVAAYTHFSHLWIGKYQRTGTINELPEFRRDMIYPLFSQFSVAVDYGFDPIKPGMDYTLFMSSFKQSSDIRTRYAIYVALVEARVLSKQALELMVQMYINDFQRIIDASPPVEKDLVLYRGVSKDVYESQKSDVVKSPFFSSAAFNPSHSALYASGKTRYLHRIKVPSGKHALFVAPLNQFGKAGEYEIVLPPCNFKVTGRNRKMKLGKEFYTVTDLTMIR